MGVGDGWVFRVFARPFSLEFATSSPLFHFSVLHLVPFLISQGFSLMTFHPFSLVFIFFCVSFLLPMPPFFPPPFFFPPLGPPPGDQLGDLLPLGLGHQPGQRPAPRLGAVGVVRQRRSPASVPGVHVRHEARQTQGRETGLRRCTRTRRAHKCTARLRFTFLLSS